MIDHIVAPAYISCVILFRFNVFISIFASRFIPFLYSNPLESDIPRDSLTCTRPSIIYNLQIKIILFILNLQFHAHVLYDQSRILIFINWGECSRLNRNLLHFSIPPLMPYCVIPVMLRLIFICLVYYLFCTTFKHTYSNK